MIDYVDVRISGRKEHHLAVQRDNKTLITKPNLYGGTNTTLNKGSNQSGQMIISKLFNQVIVLEVTIGCVVN